jgi:hypothetical protein
VAGVLAGIGASMCCVAPLLLVSLGIGGAWIGGLTALKLLLVVLVSLPLTALDPGRTHVAALVKATADAGFPSAPHP